MAKTKKAQQAYQPTGQAAADQGYQNLVSGATPYAQGLASSVIPGLQQTAQNVQNNPYYAQAQAGSNVASQLGLGVTAGQLGGASALNGLGNFATSQAQGAYQQGMGAANSALGYGQGIYDDAIAMRNAVDQGGLAYANPLLQQGMANANQSYGQAQAAIPGLTGGMGEAQRLLDNGFDPQNALYDREFQKQQDQQNALNSMYGLNTSAYGAGVAGQGARDFNLDWQNAQLARQVAALGAYGQHSGQVTSNLSNLLNTGANTYSTLSGAGVDAYTGLTNNAANNFNSLTNTGSTALNQGFDNYNNIANSAVNNFDQMSTAAGRTYGQGSQLGVDALNTLMTSQAAPGQTYLGQQEANIAALQALAQSGGQALAPTQSLIGAQGNYLGIGQNATKVSNDAIAANNAQANATNAGIGKLVGTAAGFAIGGPAGAKLVSSLF